MYRTYQSMQKHATTEYLQKDLQWLVKEFRSERNNNWHKSRLYATIFIKLFPMMIKIQKKYYTFTNEQRIEMCLTELLRALQCFDDSKKVKFSSFFYTLFSAHMITALTKETGMKRAVFSCIVKNNAEIMDTYMKVTPDRNLHQSYQEILMDLQTMDYLTREEKQLCKYILDGRQNIKEFTEAFKQDNFSLENIIDVAKKKDLHKPLFGCTNPIQAETTMEDKIRLLKTSLQKKAKKYGMFNFICAE